MNSKKFPLSKKEIRTFEFCVVVWDIEQECHPSGLLLQRSSVNGQMQGCERAGRDISLETKYFLYRGKTDVGDSRQITVYKGKGKPLG